jgi:hypothetical protein
VNWPDILQEVLLPSKVRTVELSKHLQRQVRPEQLVVDPVCSTVIARKLAHLWCSAGIRLAGATNDVHVMDFPTGKWSKIEPLGELPAPRAAHAAVAVGSMMVVQVRWSSDSSAYGYNLTAIVLCAPEPFSDRFGAICFWCGHFILVVFKVSVA